MSSWAETIVLSPNQDNTIFSENNNSSGNGPFLYAGQIQPRGGNALRRALLSFDLEGSVLVQGIPAGSTIDAVTLRLRVDRTTVGSKPAALHRLTTSWGEGSSNSGTSRAAGLGQGAAPRPNDATWNHRFFSGMNWATAGGDFEGAASATTNVAGPNVYTWSGPGLVADVQAWVDDPAQNFGWILIIEDGSTTAKRFLSKENSNAANRPQLTVEYTEGVAMTRREAWEAEHFPGDPAAAADGLDPDGDGLANLLEYAFDLDPMAFSGPASRPAGATVGEGGDTVLELTFLRDPRATDLTYRVEAAADLSDPGNWVALLESAGGADPAGAAAFTEVPEGELRRVSVTDTETLAAAAEGRRFLRLVILRSNP